MKRTLESDKPSDGSPSAASSAGRIHAKRPKSSQACSSCRKHKTRCELIDNPSPTDAGVGYRCHRCKVLNISCSFETSEFAPALHAQHARATPSPPPYLRPYGNTSGAGTEPPRIAPQNNPAALTHHRISSSVSSPHAAPPTPAIDPQQKEDYIKIEDLFPLPPNAPWGLVKVPGGFDWTATPMLAMQNITTGRTQAAAPPDAEALELHAQLANILGPDNIKSLLHIFESRYSPWLNLPPLSPASPAPAAPSMLLTLAQCLVAARHLPPGTRAAVVPPLQRLTEDAVFRHVFGAVPATASIHALMVLALWAPVGGGAPAAVRDGRLLVASAVSMAMNLRLSQAIEYVAGLKEEIRKEHGGGAVPEEVRRDLADGVEKARLWLSLMNVEWMLCIGTGRSPLSHRTALDFNAIEWAAPSPPATLSVGGGRDMRIALTGQLVEVTEAGLRIHFACKSDFGKFYKEVTDITIKFDNLLRLISPLPVVTEHEVFYFHMLLVYHHVCRLLVLHHCLRETRRVYADNSGRPWHTLAEHGGINLATQWGQEALLLAEGVLAAVLARPDLGAMATAPDAVFAMLCFAASFLVMCKLAIHQNHGADLPGSSDVLLARTIEFLVAGAAGADHAPQKCAQLISGLVASFEARTRGRERERAAGCAEERHGGLPCNTSAERTPLPGPSAYGHAHAGHVGEDGAFDVPLPGGGAGDFGRLLNSEVMLDTDFWASFMDNLTTDVPYMEGVRAS
ncbi:hypothetical protein HWV62_24528 [Athelia sp. TMB]|nr:hypothetical protein HWV62_24528 [Athelia sp. TMB]